MKSPISMAPDGYVKTACEAACEVASSAGLLAEVIEYALSAVDEFTDPFTALNEALSYYGLQVIPEIKNPVTHTITIKREANWQEPFRVDYDGKYISLFGKDTNYQVPDYGGHGQIEYEEMVLVPVVEEIRNVIPKRAECDKENIVIFYEIAQEK